jgi:Protein of unknown function (DUF1579)
MKTMQHVCAAFVAALILASAALAQPEPPKPGPEHVVLKKMEGTWDATMSAGGMESKAKMVYKMDLGGMWLSSVLEGEAGGQKFSGRGFDGYDPAKKKYVGVWVDSMSASPMLMEGTFDKEKKQLSMMGDGPGMDGKPTKYKSVTEIKDDDNMVMSMWMGEGKDPAFVVTFKRKK